MQACKGGKQPTVLPSCDMMNHNNHQHGTMTLKVSSSMHSCSQQISNRILRPTQEESHAQYQKLSQLPRASEIMGLEGEPTTTLLNQHHSHIHSKYVCLYPLIAVALIWHQGNQPLQQVTSTNQNIELWSMIPMDTPTTQLLYLWLKDCCTGRGRKIVRARICAFYECQKLYP